MAQSTISVDVIQNSWKVGQRLYAEQGGMFQSRIASRMLPFLISNRNRAGVSFANVGARALDGAVSRDSKGLYTAVVKWPKYLDFEADNTTDLCSVGDGLQYLVRTHALNKRTMFSTKIDRNLNQCSEEEIQRYIADTQKAFIEAATSKLAQQVEAEVFAKIAGGYRHIGGLPTLDGTPRVAGEDLPLFLASDASRINYAGDRILDRDRSLGGLMDYVFFGDYRAKAYAHARDISAGGDQAYNFSLLDELQTARFLFSDQMTSNTGLQNPLLVLAPGAIQFVSFAQYEQQPQTLPNDVRTIITDPIYGLKWNIVTKIDNDCNNEFFNTELTVFIDWAIISNPQCEIGDKRRDGTNGAYLYNIVCSDDTVCDLAPVKNLYTTAPVAIPSCADQDATVCGGGCNVALSAGISGDDYIVTANAVPSLGATISTYAWLVDGAPAGGNTQSLTLDNLITTGGTVITVTVTDSLGCVSTQSLIVDKDCPNTFYSLTIGGSPVGGLLNDATIAAGTIAAGAAIVFTVGNDVSSEVDMNVFTASITGDAATQSIPAVPAVLAAGDNFAMTATAEATTGNYSVTFNVTSDDCDDAAFELTVTYSIA